MWWTWSGGFCSHVGWPDSCVMGSDSRASRQIMCHLMLLIIDSYSQGVKQSTSCGH